MPYRWWWRVKSAQRTNVCSLLFCVLNLNTVVVDDADDEEKTKYMYFNICSNHLGLIARARVVCVRVSEGIVWYSSARSRTNTYCEHFDGASDKVSAIKFKIGMATATAFKSIYSNCCLHVYLIICLWPFALEIMGFRWNKKEIP